MQSSTFDTAISREHITFENNRFVSNRYNRSLIEMYCAIIQIFNSEFEENNVNFTGLIHSDTGHVLMNDLICFSYTLFFTHIFFNYKIIF